MNEEQLNQQEQAESYTGLPTFDSFSSKVTYPAFSAEEEAHSELNIFDYHLEDEDIKAYKKALENPKMYSADYLKELELTAGARLKFKMLQETDKMLVEVDKKLEGIKREQITSHATQQTTELAKQTAIHFFSALSQVGSSQDLINFAKANKDSVELLSLVHMKLSQQAGDFTVTQGKADVKQLLEEALGLPEKAELLEYKELLLRNKDLIKKDGLMYLPKGRKHISVGKLLGKQEGLS